MLALRKQRTVILCLMLLAVLYVFLGLWFTHSSYYNVAPDTNNDRLFSMDDAYYILNIYSTDMDNSLRIVKHPLFTVYAHWFTKSEQLVFGEISVTHHYWLVLASQIITAVLSIYYLYLSFVEHFKLSSKQALLLIMIYGFSISVLLQTMVAESYIFSSLFLIMTFYYSQHKKVLPVIVLGILTAGTTLTNGLLWALLAIFSKFKAADIIKIGITTVLSFLATALILFLARRLMNSLIKPYPLSLQGTL